MADKEKKALRAPEKQNFLTRTRDRIKNYWRETIGELRKVHWPTRQEATNLTIVVLTVIFFMTVLLGVLDVIYAQLFRLILA